MVKADAVFPELPTEIHLLMIDDGGKIKEAAVELLDETPSLENAIERGLERFAQLLVLDADGRQFFVGHDYAADHHDGRGYGRQVALRAGAFFTSIHGYDEE